MKYSLFLSPPIEYKPPKPHYHQLRHYNDLEYRYFKMHDLEINSSKNTNFNISLLNTESVMERILIFPNCYKLNIKFKLKK